MKIANVLMKMLIVLLLAESALATSLDDYQKFRRGTYNFGVDMDYFKSDANYTSSGDSYQQLPNGQSYELWNLNLKARYDLSKRSSWYGNLNIATANSAGFDAKRSNSSLADAQLGYAYLVYSDSLDVILDFSLLFPFSSVAENTDTVMNNEGVIAGGGLVRVQKEIGSVVPYGYIGGIYRQSRSGLLPWGAGLELHLDAVTFGGKLFGYQSVIDDPDTNKKSQRLIVNDRVNGGSLAFYGVNPSIIDSEVYAKIKLGRDWTLAAGGGATLSGSANAAGIHATVGLAFTWDSLPSYYLRPEGRSSSEDDLGSERKVPRFREETNDGVNQRLFEKKATPPPPPPAKPRPRSEIEPPTATEDVVVKRTAPRPSPSPTMDEGGEMQIKLKPKKKRRS